MPLKQIILLLPFFLSTLIYGQDTPDYEKEQAYYKTKRDSLFQFGIEVYPKFTTAFPTIDVQNSTYFKGAETWKPAYSAGITVKYRIKPAILIASGLHWQTISDKSNIIPADPQRGFLFSYTVQNNFTHLEIPLNIQYQHHSGLFAGVGFSITAILNQKQTFRNIDEEETLLFSANSILNSNRMNLTANADLGYSFELNEFNRFNVSAYAQLFLRNNLLYDSSGGTDIFPSLKFISTGMKLAYLF